jgi:hypothetical protein
VLDDVLQEINVPSVIVGATAEDLLNLIWWVWNVNPSG